MSYLRKMTTEEINASGWANWMGSDSLYTFRMPGHNPIERTMGELAELAYEHGQAYVKDDTRQNHRVVGYARDQERKLVLVCLEGDTTNEFRDLCSQNKHYEDQQHLERVVSALRSGIDPKRAVELSSIELLHWLIDNALPSVPLEDRDVKAERDYLNWEFLPQPKKA